MEIKNVEVEAIPDFERQLGLENVKYLTLCTEEGIFAHLKGVVTENEGEIEVSFGFVNNFNESIAKQLYEKFIEQNISEEIVFDPSSDAEEAFVESL